tara:strand:+ start:147 stop:650 length:504 start_codon:yes stop_codon:yes gene_type:complete
MRWFWIINVMTRIMAFSNHKPFIRSLSVTDTNHLLHEWMITISDSPYLVEHEVNANDSQLTPIVKGLIMTTEVPSSKLIDEKLLCFMVSKEARPVAIAITILDIQTLYIDNICFYPGFNEEQIYYTTIVNYCRQLCDYKNYTLNMTKLPFRQQLEYVFTIGSSLPKL